VRLGKDPVFRTADDSRYRVWVDQCDRLTANDLQAVAKLIDELAVHPIVAVVPFTAAGSGSEYSDFEQRLDKQIYRNCRILRPEQLGQPPALGKSPTYSASVLLEAAKLADFVLPAPIDAVFPPHAVAQLVLAAAQDPQADLLYADEDILSKGKRVRPFFKTDWDPFLILGCYYTGAPCLFRSSALLSAGVETLEAPTLDNLLHAVTLAVGRASGDERIRHIPAVLCHRQKPSDWRASAASHFIQEHLRLQGKSGAKVERLAKTNWNRVNFALPSSPLVSVIVPSRDKAHLLAQCCSGVLQGTVYAPLELVIIDNGSADADALQCLQDVQRDPRVRVVRDDRPFNYSRLNNEAARIASGDILVLLNNDIEVIQADWLSELVSLVLLPDVGIAGAKLHYPNGKVQHAGICFGPDKSIVHQMRCAAGAASGLHGELTLMRSLSAVTSACCAIRKELYFKIGGMNEKLAVTLNDIDLCRRIAQEGLKVVWSPFSRLVHHEAASRGVPSTPAKAELEAFETMMFWSMHPEFYETPDPFHNPQITFKPDYVDFAFPPRDHRFRIQRGSRPLRPFVY
jgi:GT2 family glycosyltransferase